MAEPEIADIQQLGNPHIPLADRFPTVLLSMYQAIFRTPDYFWFDPDSLEFRGFHLVDGEDEELQPNERG